MLIWKVFFIFYLFKMTGQAMTGAINDLAQWAIDTAGSLVNNEVWQIIMFVIWVWILGYIVLKLKGFQS